MIPRWHSGIETVSGHRFSNPKLMVAVPVIIILICLGGLKSGYALTEEIMPGCHKPSHDMEIAEGDGFIRWFESDICYLTGLVQDNGRKTHGLSGFGVTIRLMREIRFMEHEINRLQDHPSYSSPELGFHVYDTDATGWLHVLHKAVSIRKNLLAFHQDLSFVERVNINELPDGTPLYEPASGKAPKIEEVVETLAGMPLPPEVFRDYRVYILPFSMGEISGLGSKGYMLLGSPLLNCNVMENQTAFTVAHELGHHIYMTVLGTAYEENPTGWDEYMRIRGIPKWTDTGDVNSRGWFESTEETFAEDIRVLFGTCQAASEPHGTIYKDPRQDPVVAERLKEFIDRYVDTC